MAGGGYNLVAVNVPVRLPAQAPRASPGPMRSWCGKARPRRSWVVVAQTGIPKIFADVADLHQIDDRLFGNVSFEGSTFLRVDGSKTHAFSRGELDNLNRHAGHLNWFGWRYIPNLRRNGAALNHPTLYPIDYTYAAAWKGQGTVDWQPLTWEQNPTQAHIIEALGRLPVEAYTGCVVTSGSQVIRLDSARELAW